MMQANSDITHAYRHLYRGLLKAVQYSSPARYVARDQLRAAFREHPSTTGLDAEAVKRTKWFLDAAAKERGMEHRILKNLIQVRLWEWRGARKWKKHLHEAKSKSHLTDVKGGASKHYEMTVAMLNKSMGLCLR